MHQYKKCSIFVELLIVTETLVRPLYEKETSVFLVVAVINNFTIKDGHYYFGV